MAIQGLAELNKLLDEYNAEVKAVEKKARKKTAREAVAKLKNTSPKRSGNYASTWTAKQEKGKTIVHNSKNYRLTHLLENGHVIRNKYGEYGRTRPIPHIAPVEEWAATAYVIEIERLLD